MTAFGCFRAEKFNRGRKKFIRILLHTTNLGGQMTTDRAISTGRETDGAPPAAGNSARRTVWIRR